MTNNFEKLVASYAAENQEINDAALALLSRVFLDGAEGVQLDGLGQIIGVDRGPFDDDQYRALLRAQILVNRSSGTIAELITIVATALGQDEADTTLTLTESFPLDFVLTNTTITPVGLGSVIADLVYSAKAAAVHGIFQYFDTTPVFAFDGFGGSKFDGGFFLRSAIRNRGRRESEDE